MEVDDDEVYEKKSNLSCNTTNSSLTIRCIFIIVAVARDTSTVSCH